LSLEKRPRLLTLANVSELEKYKEYHYRTEQFFEDTTKNLQNRLMKLNERLKEEPYPWTSTDALILQAGISLLKELLEALGE